LTIGTEFGLPLFAQHDEGSNVGVRSEPRQGGKYLARFRESGVLNQIGGETLPASDGTTFETISPVDLKPLAGVAHGKAADIDRAAKTAKRAFAAWAALAGEKRKQLLHKIADDRSSG
jgi:5-carboxymethyl-2-hydroxymuconic-semialdehyde dehydrogenase